MDEELVKALDKVLSLSGGDPTVGKFVHSHEIPTPKLKPSSNQCVA